MYVGLFFRVYSVDTFYSAICNRLDPETVESLVTVKYNLEQLKGGEEVMYSIIKIYSCVSFQ